MPSYQSDLRQRALTTCLAARRWRLRAAMSGMTVMMLAASVQPAGAFSLIGVNKQIVNHSGQPTPPGPYQVQVDCSPGGPHTTVSLTSPSTLNKIVTVPAGSVCSIVELTPPPAPKGCTWKVGYPDGQQVKAGATGIVVNELKCSGGGDSRVTVTKRIVNNSGLPTPTGPYQVQVDCSPSGPHTTIGLTSPNNLQQTVAVPTGSMCSIAELPPPPPRKDCKWFVSYPNGERTTAGGSLSVVNELKCSGGGDSRVTVTKRIVNNTGLPTPVGPYQVQVDCSPNGPHTTLGLTSPNNLQQTVAAPTGSVCSIAETPPPPPRKDCRWQVSYPNGRQTAAGGSLIVVNELKCAGT